MAATLDEILQRVSKTMQGEDRKDLTFRLLIAASEFGDALSHVTHDTSLNPSARPYSKEEERLAHGQVYVQLFAAAELRQAGLTKSAISSFFGESKTDGLPELVARAKQEAAYYKPEQLALESFIAGAKFLARISPLASLQSLPEIEAATANWIYRLLLFTCNRSIEPYGAIELALKNWEDYDWKRRVAEQATDKEIRGIGVNSGYHKGKVVLYSPSTRPENLPKGSVLILDHFKPEMFSYLENAGAVVTDHGGKTCHLALVMNDAELPNKYRGIPCIVSTEKATKLLKPDMLVEVQCYGEPGNRTGIVRIIDEPTGQVRGSEDVHHETYYH